MYTVVVGVDESEERARNSVQAVLGLPGDPADKRVVVFHSFVDNPSGASATQIGSVREATDLLSEAGVESVVEESSGDPAEQILELAEDREADLIVIGGRKRSPAGKALFGSVTQTVILNADRPVMVTGGAKAE